MLTASTPIGLPTPQSRRIALLRATLPLALVSLTLAAILAAVPARASAAVESGSLTQLSEPSNCIGEVAEAVAACGTSVPYGLSFAYQVQVSPDARYAYSVAVNGDLLEYERNLSNGALTVIGCVSSIAKSEPACAAQNAEMEVTAMADPAAIAISPDGHSAYVVTQGANNLVEFSRDTETGLLTKVGCITHEAASAECTTVGAKGLNLPYGLTVSPDGENVYVASYGDEAVAEFKRNTETGVLTQLEGANNCISDTSLSECGTTTGVIGLKEAIGVVVSPDGKNVYVAAGARSAEGDIAEFARGAEGALVQLSGEEACIGEKVAGCKEGQHLQGSEDLAVSPGGKNVYANSYHSNAVIELKRTAAGALEPLASPAECVSSEALTGCTQVKSVGGALGIAISPGGEDLYASSGNENAVAVFKRGAEGALEQLTKDPCVTDEASGCEPPGADDLVGLKYARRLTVSPDGTNVYVAGQEDHAIVELARTVTPTVATVVPARGAPEGKTSVTIRGSNFREGAAVEFEGKAATNVTVHSAGWITAESPAGSGVQHVAVTNPAGESAHTANNEFTYTHVPAVIGVGADVGGETGGTVVTITGSELLGATAVRFGSTPAAGFTVNSDESITATTPASTGTVDVTVTTPDGTSTPSVADKFSYVNGSPSPQSGLVLQAYCQGLGYHNVSRIREEVGGPGFAYENWACVESNGTEVPIANAGPAPSMSNACEMENPGVTVYGYANEPNSAFSWGCYKVVPPEAGKGGGGGGGEEGGNKPSSGGGEEAKNPSALKLASETIGPVSPAIAIPTTAVPPPVLARTGNVAPVSGTVLVKLPGTSVFVALSTLQQIPFGSVIEATNGTVSVTTALPGGGTQTGEFFEGEFILRQGPNGLVVAELTGGNFSVCPTARERSHIARVRGGSAWASTVGAHTATSGSHVVRKLWANAHGKFSTKGNYAAGAVQGTEWLTEDLCDGTLIRVTRDKVAVTNLVTHRHVEVKTGHHYLAKAP
jgi:DNA-binding beta-propeller fold protein YncE